MKTPIAMQTAELFRDDSYLRECRARVVSVNERGGIILDRTVFYPTGGGQEGDSGILETESGKKIPIATTVKGTGSENVVHVPKHPTQLAPGEQVTACIDWERRYAHMRMHTCLHLLCALIPHSVTGGQIGAERARLDFDPQGGRFDKTELTERLNALIQADKPLRVRVFEEKALDENPDLVRTLSVKPPRGSGSVRMIEIENTDLQPCGGTHVKRTGEIGKVQIAKIENKGKHNRRVVIVFAK